MSFEYLREVDDKEVKVVFSYYPGEPQTYWQPKVWPEVEIENIFLGDKDIYDLVSQKDFDRLELEIMEGFDDWYDDPYADEA